MKTSDLKPVRLTVVFDVTKDVFNKKHDRQMKRFLRSQIKSMIATRLKSITEAN
jgi:hypothetical protein